MFVNEVMLCGRPLNCLSCFLCLIRYMLEEDIDDVFHSILDFYHNHNQQTNHDVITKRQNHLDSMCCYRLTQLEVPQVHLVIHDAVPVIVSMVGRLCRVSHLLHLLDQQ